jgi:hypothetical protein
LRDGTGVRPGAKSLRPRSRHHANLMVPAIPSNWVLDGYGYIIAYHTYRTDEFLPEAERFALNPGPHFSQPDRRELICPNQLGASTR